MDKKTPGSFAGVPIPQIKERSTEAVEPGNKHTRASIGTYTGSPGLPGQKPAPFHVDGNNPAVPSRPVPRTRAKKKPAARDTGIGRDEMDQMLVARLLTMAAHGYATPRAGGAG